MNLVFDLIQKYKFESKSQPPEAVAFAVKRCLT